MIFCSHSLSPAKFNTKSLNLDEEFLDVNDFIPDERLKEDADQSDQPVLHVPAGQSLLPHSVSPAATYLSLMVSHVEMQFEM